MFDPKNLKYNAQVRADELALEQYGQDFYDLTDQQQYDLYSTAYQLEVEKLILTAESMWEHRI